MNIKRIITLALPIVLILSVLNGCGRDNTNIANKSQTSDLVLEKILIAVILNLILQKLQNSFF